MDATRSTALLSVALAGQGEAGPAGAARRARQRQERTASAAGLRASAPGSKGLLAGKGESGTASTASLRASAPSRGRAEGAPQAEAQGADASDSEAAFRERARREREEYERKLRTENELSEDFRRAMHKLAERPILIPHTLQETDRQVQPLDLEAQAAKQALDSRLELFNRQMAEVMRQAGGPGQAAESRRRLLAQSRSLVAEHLSTLGALSDQFHEKLADFAGAPQAQSEIALRLQEIQARRSALEEYYELLGHIAGPGAGAAEIGRVADNAQADPGLVRQARVLQRQQEGAEAA
jgi:hypothetical protein